MERNSAPRRDLVRRFIFENQPVRGHWVHLDAAWQELRAHAHYPPAVTELLGEAVAAAVLLAATLKFRGTLSLQLQGDGALGLLVAQCTHDFRVRAVARCQPGAARAGSQGSHGVRFRELVGSEGRITVSIEAEESNLHYEGVVPLTGDSLAQSLETYFASSEQLPTRVVLAANQSHGAGMLVQKLPQEEESEAAQDAWESAQQGIGRLKSQELLRGDVEQLLAMGFSGNDLRLFRGTPVKFQCRCSQGRVAGLLRALGADEVREVLKEQGSVTVTCEFCHRPYRFDPVDVEALFTAEGSTLQGSEKIH